MSKSARRAPRELNVASVNQSLSDLAGIVRPSFHRLERLYHVAEATNLDSILKHGLMSTKRLMDLADVSESDRASLLRSQRRTGVQLADGISIRDQKPMPPATLAKTLDDGLQPSDWYELLNSFVFLWPDMDRVERHRRACAGRSQVLFTFDGASLLNRLDIAAFVYPINSGNALRNAARRGRGTFVPYVTWIRDGWPTGQRRRPPAELLLNCVVPVRGPHVVDIAEI